MMDTAEQIDNKFSVFNQSSTATTFNKNPNPNHNYFNLFNYENKTMVSTSSSRTATVDDLIQLNDQDSVNPSNHKWGASWGNLSTIVEQEDLNNNNMKMDPEVSEQLSQLEKIKRSLYNNSFKQKKKNDYTPISNIGGTWGESESPSKPQKTWDNFGTNDVDHQRKQPSSKYWKTSESTDEPDYRAVGGLLPKSNNIWSNLTTNDTPWPKDKTLFPNSDLHEATQTQTLDSSVELIRSTKEYRILIGKGFNREDVETALRNSFLNFDVALETLKSGQNQQFTKTTNNNNSSFVNRMGPQPQTLQRRPVPLNISQTPQPSIDQLKIIVQQVQLAVQAGYLNGQILNQPLAPQTLLLMNQLLLQIRDIKKSEQYLARGGPNSYQLSVNMEKTKQFIHNIQIEIAFHQDLYMKQVFNAPNHLQRRPSPPMEMSHGFSNQIGPRAVTNYWKGNIPGEYNMRGNGPIQAGGGGNSSYSFKQQLPMYDDWQQNASIARKPSVTPPFTEIVETAPEFQPGKPWKSGGLSTGSSISQCQPKEGESSNNFLSLSSSTWSYNPDAGLGLPSYGPTNLNTDGIKWSNDELGQSRIPSDVWGVTNPADTNWAQ